MIWEDFYVLGRGRHDRYRHGAMMRLRHELVIMQACSVGVLGKVRDDGAECGLVKDMRYMPDDGHLVAIRR